MEARELVDLAIRVGLMTMTAWVIFIFQGLRRSVKTPLVVALMVWLITTELSLVWYVVASFNPPSTEMWMRDHSWFIQLPRLLATAWLLYVMRWRRKE